MQLEMLGQFGQRPVFALGSLGHLRLGRCRVGVAVRRADFLTIKNSFSPDRLRSGFIHRVFTYSAVQIFEATSLSAN